MTPEERAVQAAAARIARAREDLETAMQEARDAGLSLRRIGKAAGVSQTYIERRTTAPPMPTPESLGIDTAQGGWLTEYMARIDGRRFKGVA